jgi:hypothetical protein
MKSVQVLSRFRTAGAMCRPFAASLCAALCCIMPRPAAATLRFDLSPQFGPMVFAGESIFELLQRDIDNDGVKEIIVMASNQEGTSSSIYAYSPEGILKWKRTFPFLVWDLDIRDCDKDDTDEILVLGDTPTFHVLSHTGEDEWTGSTADPLANLIARYDLTGDGKDDIIAFSSSYEGPRGAITVFDFATHAPLGARVYSESEVGVDGPPWLATVADLDGDGSLEIIPDPELLNKRIEILDHTAQIAAVKTLNERAARSKVTDLNGDGKNDLLVETWDDEWNSVLYAYLGYTGTDFSSEWKYPSSGSIKQTDYLNVGDGKVAFGTQDWEELAGGGLYILDAATGAEAALPLAVEGMVDDVKFKDLNGDGVRELAALTHVFTDPVSTWTLKSYDQHLQLLAPTGHLTWSRASSDPYDACFLRVADLTDDGFVELIPRDYNGTTLFVARYDGVLKWQFPLDGPQSGLGISDLNGDGKNDLIVSAGETSIYTLADGGNSGVLLGSKAGLEDIRTPVSHDFDGDGNREIMGRLWGEPTAAVLSFDCAVEYLNQPLAGDFLYDVDYSNDMDGNGVDDLFYAVGDSQSQSCTLYLYFGRQEGLDVAVRGGGPLIVEATVQQIGRRFDAYGGFLLPGGAFYSFDLRNPSALRRGVQPLATGVPGITAPVTRTLLSLSPIPPGAPDTATLIVGLVPEGAAPSIAAALPGYLVRRDVSLNAPHSPTYDDDEYPDEEEAEWQ